MQFDRSIVGKCVIFEVVLFIVVKVIFLKVYVVQSFCFQSSCCFYLKCFFKPSLAILYVTLGYSPQIEYEHYSFGSTLITSLYLRLMREIGSENFRSTDL